MKPQKQSLRKTLGTIWWILRLWMKLDKWGFLGYLISEVADPILNVARWYVLAYFVDQAQAYVVSRGNILNYLTAPFLLFVLLYIIFRASVSAASYFGGRRQYRFDWKLEELFVKKIQDLSLYDMDNRSFANTIALANEAKNNLPTKLNNVISMTKNSIATIVLGIPLILQGYGFVFLGMILVTIPSMLVNIRFQEKQIKLKLSRVETRRRSMEALEVHTGISEESKEIKINNAYPILRNRGLDEKIAFNEMLLEHQKQWFWGRSVSSFLESVILPIFLVYYVLKTVAGQGALSGIIPFFGTIMTIRITVYNFMNSFVQISEYYEEILRVRNFLGYVPAELFVKRKALPSLDAAPEISLQEVSFAYPETNREVLSKISLEVKKGEKIAIVGANGVGKTTLIKLLLGMYPPTIGAITVQGNNLFHYTKEQWYDTVGVVFQEFPKYGFLSVKENIAIGRPGQLEDEKIWNVLKRADAEDFVMKYEDKLNQGLNHRYKDGVSPSTGQWQKLAIARMFYRNPHVVIFDEPTASIDAEAEYKIFNEIFEFFKDKTVIIVSHRFSTVRNADRIVVLSEGSIAEMGNHSELMKRNGLYASSFRKQSEGYKE